MFYLNVLIVLKLTIYGCYSNELNSKLNLSKNLFQVTTDEMDYLINLDSIDDSLLLNTNLLKEEKNILRLNGYLDIELDNYDLIEQFIHELSLNENVKIDLNLTCVNHNCEQKNLILIYKDKLYFEYELIRQNIFLDESNLLWHYLNCFFIQYNPNSGIRSYFSNRFSFNYKKAFINECSNKEEFFGTIYLFDNFIPLLTKYKNVSNLLLIKYDLNSKSYYLYNEYNSNQSDDLNFKNIFNSKFDDKLKLNKTSFEHDLWLTYSLMSNIVNKSKLNLNERINLLNKLNVTYLKNGLNQKRTKLMFLKAQIVLDDALLILNESRKHKFLNKLFLLIYETQNYFRQINLNLIIVRFNTRMPNKFDLYSDTNLQLNVTNIYNELKYYLENEIKYYVLKHEFTIFFTSMKFYLNNKKYLLNSHSTGLIGQQNAFILLHFNYKRKNQWLLLAYEIGHLLNIHDDYNQCLCLTSACIMNYENYLNKTIDLNDLSWSLCTVVQFLRFKHLFKDKLDLDEKYSKYKIDTFDKISCGNGFLEGNEECDCGPYGCFYFNEEQNKYLNHNCCNKENCSLNTNSTCAHGTCCNFHECKIKNRNSVCRKKLSVCDLEETCDGLHSVCPIDNFYIDGEKCGSNSYCFNKMCTNSYNDRLNCKFLFGSNAFTYNKCYGKNLDGTSLYNCGYSIAENRWIKCNNLIEAKCGSFMCAMHKKHQVEIKDKQFSSIFDFQIENTTDENFNCILVLYKNLKDALVTTSPFYALDGTYCDENKFCSKTKCLNYQNYNELVECHKKNNCPDNSKCTSNSICRCMLNLGGNIKDENNLFNLNSTFNCPRLRSLNTNYSNKTKYEYFKFEPYYFLIIPCFIVIAVMTLFLQNYFKSGVYKVSSKDDLSVSFSGTRPSPVWIKPEKVI